MRICHSSSLVADSRAAVTAVLFYLAKKRQWAVRDSLRRSVRRVTRRDRPETSRTGDYTRSRSRGVTRIDSPPNTARSQPSRGEKAPMLTETPWKRDVEKGYNSKKSSTPATPAPLSSFDMDSPRNAQGPIWTKVFGKR